MRIVSFNTTHDSSICSYVDGNIEFYCKEERLSRVKRDSHPYLCLNKFFEKNFGKVDYFLYLTPTNNFHEAFFLYGRYIKKFFNVELINFSCLNHHEVHASISFYNSGFEQALVFVIDRDGSVVFDNCGNISGRESESVYRCSYPDNIVPIYKSFWLENDKYKNDIENNILSYYQSQNFSPEINLNNQWSIVKVYEAATTLIGQHPLENGKTMGISSYGEDLDYSPLFYEGRPISNYFTSLNVKGYNDIDLSCFYRDVDKITDSVTEDNYQFYANKAKHVQIETQKEVLKLIKKYVGDTGIKNVCISGGYGLNVVANNYYIKNLPEVNFYFEPLSDDSGITIGASMLKYRQETKDKNIYTLKDNFYHYYDSDDRIFGDKTNISDLVQILEDQKVLAVFDGNPESGPRALGHRSLLFDPRNKDGKEIVNTLKNREWYRPFAGIILETEFEKYFDTLGLSKSEYMTISFKCKEGVNNYVPSIMHVDNTCRIQTVSEKDGFIFDLLKSFYDKTGCPFLLNTSFNLAGDPLIQTKDDVIKFTSVVKNNKFFAGTFFVDTKTLLTIECILD